MITSQMSYEELANEVAKDYMDVSIIMRKKMPDALKYFRRQSKFPMFLFSTVTSPRKNKWILIFFAKSKRRLKQYVDSFLVCVRETDHGKYVYRYDLPVKEGSLPGVTFYPPHFFSRYALRMGLELTGEDLIKRYFKTNTAMHYNADHLFLSEEEMKDLLNPVWYTSPDGISLGSATVVSGMELFICKTFVPWNMCKRDQLITCGKEKKSYDSYKKSLGSKTDGFNDLLTQLVNMCIDAKLLTDKIQDYPDEKQILVLKQILEENTVPKEEKDKYDEEFKALQEKHSRISLQLTNIKRAKKEQEEYIKSLGLVEDSLKPVEVLHEKIISQGSNMWTSHVVKSLKSSLEKISSNKRLVEALPFVSEQATHSLELQLKSIEDSMEKITKQKGSLYQQVNNIKLIGFLESKIVELERLWQKKHKELKFRK